MHAGRRCDLGAYVSETEVTNMPHGHAMSPQIPFSWRPLRINDCQWPPPHPRGPLECAPGNEAAHKAVSPPADTVSAYPACATIAAEPFFAFSSKTRNRSAERPSRVAPRPASPEIHPRYVSGFAWSTKNTIYPYSGVREVCVRWDAYFRSRRSSPLEE